MLRYLPYLRIHFAYQGTDWYEVPQLVVTQKGGNQFSCSLCVSLASPALFFFFLPLQFASLCNLFNVTSSRYVLHMCWCYKGSGLVCSVCVEVEVLWREKIDWR